MQKAKLKNQARARRQKRVRAKISGTAERPRLSVFRSLTHTYAQLIDDVAGRTLAAVKDKDKEATEATKQNGAADKAAGSGTKGKIAAATAVGETLAKKALAQNIKQAVFDKSAAKYHGRVKAVAEGARSAGLKI